MMGFSLKRALTPPKAVRNLAKKVGKGVTKAVKKVGGIPGLGTLLGGAATLIPGVGPLVAGAMALGKKVSDAIPKGLRDFGKAFLGAGPALSAEERAAIEAAGGTVPGKVPVGLLAAVGASAAGVWWLFFRKRRGGL